MTNNIPPKQMPGSTPLNSAGPTDSLGYDHLPPLDAMPGPQSGALVSIHDPALHGDAGAFPVLKAFQDYLETERQQARKRLITLTAFFVSLMALVVGGFVVAFIFLFNRMSHQQDLKQDAATRMQEVLLQAALQQRTGPVAPAPAAVPSAIEASVKQVESVALNIQTNLGVRLADVGDTTTRLNAKLDAQNKEMALLQASLAGMRQDNTKLRDELPKLALDAARRVSPQVAPSAVLPPARPASSTSIAVAPIASTAGTFAATAGQPPLKGYSETLLLIRSRTGDETIPWHAFIPE